MKKNAILLLATVMMIPVSLVAQIPNNGFEDWSPVGNCQEPEQWHSTNLFDTTSAFCPVSRSTDHYPTGVGNYSMQLENDLSLFPSFSAFGIVSSTRLDGTDQPLFPVAGHPNFLCGYFKFQCMNRDTMSINIYLSYQGVELSSGHLLVDSTVADWTPFILPLSAYQIADSARITIMACNIEGAGVQGNSVLHIDNLSFDTLISAGITDPAIASGLRLYPNPADGHLRITCVSPTERMTNIELFDCTGQQVLTMSLPEAQSDEWIDVSNLVKGVYFASVSTVSGKRMIGKLVVNR